MANSWKTLFESESVTTYDDGNGHARSNAPVLKTDYPLFTETSTLRLTVDGKEMVGTHTPELDKVVYFVMGNRHFLYPEDYGDNYILDFAMLGKKIQSNIYGLYFYSRTTGTYSVRLEVAVPGTESTHNPTAMLTGFQVGQALRRMRK